MCVPPARAPSPRNPSQPRPLSPQARDYDLQGDYVRAWCPELRNVPAERVHEPWLMSREEQERYGCR